MQMEPTIPNAVDKSSGENSFAKDWMSIHVGLNIDGRDAPIGGRLTEPWSILTETRSDQLTE